MLDINQFPLVDQLIIYLIGAIIVGLVITLLSIFIYRFRYMLFDRKQQKFRSTLLSLLSAALNYPEKNVKYKKQLSHLVKSKWQKEMLLDELVQMSYSFSGVYEERSKELYYHFELDKISIKKLSSAYTYRIVEGIIELSIVGNKSAYSSILPLVDHHESQVRKQAKIAMVEIGEIKGLMEMESRIGIMSKWTFLSILSILHRSPFKLNKHQLEQLKNSKNPATRRLTNYLDKYSVTYQ
ncbi:MAG: hypothetical protein CMB80_24925 [Flammeovirgaceae bacterium]|nr:hypothetical protein [Flammeovirgaceae bacterium]MBE61923.1 hypothetical protein [Flammeovirgaceae bacterium]MBR08728.1 hypothetical protein [Rickettsiales bacterium]HCX23301.1 hypothetical protein [Cytophagales bacterium]|tara:strand:+ start:10805 stop:11521 length:717 start_codon:yes stop_codon:yes gene_type:complete